MFRIQTLNTISPIGLNQFPRELYEVASKIEDPDAILVRSQDMHNMTLPSSVKAVGRAGAGINNIPIETLTMQGIPVFNTPGANANAVNELVLAGMLLASRHICQAWDYVVDLKANDHDLEQQIEQNKKQFSGVELFGKTLGIIGLGSIGVKVANTAVKLGMQVIGYDPLITINRAWELSSSVKQAHNMEDVLRESDFISLHVPLTDETKNLLDRSRLQLIKSGAVLLNFARDGIIDNAVLLDALNNKKIFAYVNDFPSAELKNHANVISLPHIGASTKEAEENCAVMIAKQLRDFLENGTINHSVNFPRLETSNNHQGVRLAIVNANIPNMVAQISSKLASAGHNIVSLVNKSRDNVAYTVIDIDADVSDVLLEELANIGGVIQVRKLLVGNRT